MCVWMYDIVCESERESICVRWNQSDVCHPLPLRLSQAALFPCSANLARLPPPLLTTFLHSFTQWLPTPPHIRVCMTLLYRGSRDGMTAHDFHAACDHMGATVTLIRSRNACTFGGYSSLAWATSESQCRDYGPADARTAFLFGVQCPSVRAPVLLPLLPGPSCVPIVRRPGFGPCFGHCELIVHASEPSGTFSSGAHCSSRFVPGGMYSNVVEGGQRVSFTGREFWKVEEMEVYGVAEVVMDGWA